MIIDDDIWEDLKEERLAEDRADEYAEKMIRSDWDYFIEHAEDVLVEPVMELLDDARDYFEFYGWNVDEDEIRDFLKELIDKV